jgi:PAS domain S-box-containing protein
MWIVDLESCRFLAVNDAAIHHYGYSREEFLAMSATELRPPEDVPLLLTAVAEAARGWPETGMTAPATWRHRKKSGELIEVEIYWSPIEFEGRPASLAMLSDTTDRKLAEKRLHHQARLLQALQDVAVAANQATSVDEALQHCLNRLCVLTGWPVGHIYLLGDEPDLLVPTKLWYLADPKRFEAFRAQTESMPMRAGVGLPGRVLATGKPTWVEDPNLDRNFPRSTSSRESGLRAGFGFPILVGSSIAGVMEFFLTEARAPDPEMLHAMSHTGAQVGRVLERERAAQELRQSRELFRELARRLQSIREEEQSRISREIHDELGQQLSAIRFDVASIQKRVGASSDSVGERLEHALEGLDATIESVRKIAGELRPALLEDLGLAAAIEWLTQWFASQYRIPATVEGTLPDASVDKERAVAAYRILQEALTNVARHAQASRVTVRADVVNGELCMEVRDDGRGVSTQDLAKARVFGVVGMRERASAFGGSVTVERAEGGGTRVLLCLPLGSPAGAQPAAGSAS